jgi:serine/threonine protein kinase
MDVLRSFILSSDASPEDLLLRKSIDFIPLSTLPYLELEHLSDLFHTEDATSILQNEITGPSWHIKMKPTDNTELKPLPEFVAVKQYFEELNAVFQEEFLFLNAIHGQHCVTITHVLGRQGVPVGLLMEHLPLLLDEAMQHFSLSVAVSVLVKCAAAIHSLHISNVVHSNINTSSFILSSDYCSVKLAEFAIDQCILSSIGFLHKQEPFFVAPEMPSDGAVPTILTDIYAFGALTWCLIHPLSMLPNGNAPIAVSLAAARGSLPLFTAAGVPFSISDVCHRCMSRDPHSRPQSMLDIMLVLSAVQSTLESSN